jgi:hypothetical protein
MYKDKDKQREANRQAQARFKAKMAAGIDEGVAMQKRLGITEGIRSEGITDKVLPDYPRVSGQDFTRLMATAGPDHVRVSKPGDADYEPQCETTRAHVDNRAKRPSTAKEVKCFEDLPWDVQQAIDIMSVVEGKIDQTIKANRTAIAIHYQHLFPDRFYSVGVA